MLDTEVDEAFPLSADAEVPSDMSQEEVEANMAKVAESNSETSEELPATEPDLVERVSGQFVGASGQFVGASGQFVGASGQSVGADDFHQGSCRATIYELPDGGRVLRLDEFMVTNGPNLDVLLVPHPDPQSRADVEGYLDLGLLKGNIGSQNYEIPADANLTQYETVVTYCVPFHVIFAIATFGSSGGRHRRERPAGPICVATPLRNTTEFKQGSTVSHWSKRSCHMAVGLKNRRSNRLPSRSDP